MEMFSVQFGVSVTFCCIRVMKLAAAQLLLSRAAGKLSTVVLSLAVKVWAPVLENTGI